MLIKLSFLVFLGLASPGLAQAQWGDPGGTWAGAPVVSSVQVVAVAEVPQLAADPLVEESSVVEVARPSTPVNPFENLPAGAVAPSRPAVPANPYEGLPVSVVVRRPSVPCTRFTPQHCSPGEVPLW